MEIVAQIHDPLLDRLSPLVQQRSFHDQPALGWVIGNYLNADYLDEVIRVSRSYGVKTLILDDSYFDWSRLLIRNAAIADWLATTVLKIRSGGLEAGILVEHSSQRDQLERENFSNQEMRFDIFSRQEQTIIDGLAARFGAGKLPYLAFDSMIAQIKGDRVLVTVDQPGSAGIASASWGQVFGISFSMLTETTESDLIEQIYFESVFGSAAESMRRAFKKAREAIEKSFLVQGAVEMMDRGRWPRDLNHLDRQIQSRPELSEPSREVLNQIDLEKVEALEAAYDAWTVVDDTRPTMDPITFLWVEHYFLRLKIVCMALRLMSEAYFSMRALPNQMPRYTVEAKSKDFTKYVREHRAILSEFAPCRMVAGTEPLGDFIKALCEKMESTI